MNPHPLQNGCFPIFPLYDLTGRLWRKLSTFNCNCSYRGLTSAAQISEIVLQLNLELINLSEWLSTNKLILNLKRTQFMVFGTNQRPCRQDINGAHITLGEESMKPCDACKYLGLVLDISLSFYLHIDYGEKKVSKTLRMFSRIRSSLTTEASNRLYKSMILPNLEYCCAVFHGCGKGNEEELERLQAWKP